MMKRLFFVLPSLLGLIACTNQETVPPPADAGADAPTDTSADAGTDAPATCEAPCGDGERCIEGACKPVDTLSLSLTENLEYYEGKVVSIKNTARACGNLARVSSDPALPPPLGAEGDCKAWGYQPDSFPPGAPWLPAPTGGVTISTPTGPIPLSTMDDLCAETEVKHDLFSQGILTTFEGDGTGKFPAFHFELTPPPQFQLVTSALALVRGQALPLTWQAATSERVAIDVFTLPKKGSTKTPPWIRCEVPDTGSLTIPGSLTAFLDPEGTFSNIFIQRRSHSIEAPESSQVRIHISVTRMNQLLLPYTP